MPKKLARRPQLEERAGIQIASDLPQERLEGKDRVSVEIVGICNPRFHFIFFAHTALSLPELTVCRRPSRLLKILAKGFLLHFFQTLLTAAVDTARS